MKNLFMIVILILGITMYSGADTWTNHLGLGWRMPSNSTITANEPFGDFDYDIKSSTGLSTFYLGTHRNGFSVKGELNFNHADFNSLEAVNVELIFGFGYAPINNESLFLAIYGTVGGNVYETETIYNDVYLEVSNGTIGIDVSAAYTFGKHFSIYGSLGLNYLLTGELATRRNNKTLNKFDTDSSCTVTPVVGICWKF